MHTRCWQREGSALTRRVGALVTRGGSSSRLCTHYQQDTCYSAMPSLLSGSSIWLGLGLGALADCVHFTRRVVSRLVSGWCPSAKDRCVGAIQGHIQQRACVAAMCWPLGAPHPLERTHENGTTGWGQNRSRTSSACSDGATAGVVMFRSTRSQDARCNTTSFLYCYVLYFERDTLLNYYHRVKV